MRLLTLLVLLSAAVFAQPTPEHEAWRAQRAPALMDDFGELAHYRKANAALKPQPGRVVFFGDSITEGWKLGRDFPGQPYVNRGISAQTTPQMLVRFRADVINLKPAAVVILAGINDLSGNTGPTDNATIEGNYASLAELARAHKIRVIFCSVLPIHHYTPESQPYWAEEKRPRILALNTWLKNYCREHDLTYVDYFSVMVDKQGMLRQELAQDGLHPNPAGYAIMAKLVQAALK